MNNRIRRDDTWNQKWSSNNYELLDEIKLKKNLKKFIMKLKM